MKILLVCTLFLLGYCVFLVMSLYNKVHDLEDTIHALHHDMDLKIDDIKDKLNDGEAL